MRHLDNDTTLDSEPVGLESSSGSSSSGSSSSSSWAGPPGQRIADRAVTAILYLNQVSSNSTVVDSDIGSGSSSSSSRRSRGPRDGSSGSSRVAVVGVVAPEMAAAAVAVAAGGGAVASEMAAAAVCLLVMSRSVLVTQHPEDPRSPQGEVLLAPPPPHTHFLPQPVTIPCHSCVVLCGTGRYWVVLGGTVKCLMATATASYGHSHSAVQPPQPQP